MKDLIEGLCKQVGQTGQAQWYLTGHGHLVPEPGHVGPPWGNQNDPAVCLVLQLLHHFAQDGCWWEWSGQVWIACLLSYSVSRGCGVP